VQEQPGYEEDVEEDETACLFRQAAEALKEKREEALLPVEERIVRCASSKGICRS
jgi:hypothetical protein